MKDKLMFDYRYFEFCIDFNCICGDELSIDDNDENFTIECDKCHRKYKFYPLKDKLILLEEELNTKEEK